jgi:hypothetical protein
MRRARDLGFGVTAAALTSVSSLGTRALTETLKEIHEKIAKNMESSPCTEVLYMSGLNLFTDVFHDRMSRWVEEISGLEAKNRLEKGWLESCHNIDPI